MKWQNFIWFFVFIFGLFLLDIGIQKLTKQNAIEKSIDENEVMKIMYDYSLNYIVLQSHVPNAIILLDKKYGYLRGFIDFEHQMCLSPSLLNYWIYS